MAGRRAALYLAGYLTTDDVAFPDDPWVERALRVPNRELLRLFSKEIPLRFVPAEGGERDVRLLHRALRGADEDELRGVLAGILRESASCFDLVSENSYHMMLLGLCFGMEGYAAPRSNREEGLGRPDIQLVPEDVPGAMPVRGPQPLITVELKCLPGNAKGAGRGDKTSLEAKLHELACSALAQIAARGYDDGPLPACAAGRVRWGVACCGKRVAVACERLG